MQSQFESEPARQSASPALEKYLDALCLPLREELSSEECEATRQELRAHLLLSAEARQELGASPEEALKEALLHFGDPEMLGEKLAQEKTAPLRQERRRVWGERILGGMLGGLIGQQLTITCSLLLASDWVHEQPPLALHLLLILLGARTGWLLASERNALQVAWLEAP